MLFTHPMMKLGKRAPRLDPRTLRLSKYLKTKIGLPVPPAPATESYILEVPRWPMMLNDSLGDCVIAAMGHMTMQWSWYATGGKSVVTPTDAQILEAYKAIGGYVPGDSTTDRGCDMLTALKFWRKRGLAGNKILAYMAVDPLNVEEVQQAVWLFGNLFCGLALPLSAQTPVEPAKWTVPVRGPYEDGSPNSWGGHAVSIMASSAFMHPLVTWGRRWTMTRNFRTAYCDELYAVLSPDWIAAGGLAPSGFDLAALRADLAWL